MKWLPTVAILSSQTRGLSKRVAVVATISALLLTSCGSREVSTEEFCSSAVTVIATYDREVGLTTLGGVFFPNTSGLSIFAELEPEIIKLQKADPVKFYTLATDQAVMRLCKIEVK
jgi:hypothetical protein